MSGADQVIAAVAGRAEADIAVPQLLQGRHQDVRPQRRNITAENDMIESWFLKAKYLRNIIGNRVAEHYGVM